MLNSCNWGILFGHGHGLGLGHEGKKLALMNNEIPDSYWQMVWKRFKRHRLGYIALFVVFLFCFFGIYAPFFASSKPIFIIYQGTPYFPLFRYLFYSGFFTKHLDIFFNLLMFTLPLFILALKWMRSYRGLVSSLFVLGQCLIFIYLVYFPLKDPANDVALSQERHEEIKKMEKNQFPSWDFELKYMNDYAKLNQITRYRNRYKQDQDLEHYATKYITHLEKKRFQEALRERTQSYTRQGKTPPSEEILKKEAMQEVSTEAIALPTLWQLDLKNQEADIARLQTILNREPENSEAYQNAKDQLSFVLDKKKWLEEQSKEIDFILMPFFSSFHWEDDAGGQQALNQYLPWWELTRSNRKDLLAALIFGIRISLSVGLISVAIALAIGIPIGAYAGYYGGKVDILVSRLLEIWEAMPVFFMLLMVVAVLQSKSIFLVTLIIGLFGWTHFSRYIRGEFFKQRNLPYVEACHALGFKNHYIVFKHILPNSIPPILTLLPFSIMAAITSEAGLSFLGLGEEGSCSWGVLMDEGRNAFPAESYLLWPPAILLTLLLVAIALVGDSLRDTLDPKIQIATL